MDPAHRTIGRPIGARRCRLVRRELPHVRGSSGSWLAKQTAMKGMAVSISDKSRVGFMSLADCEFLLWQVERP